MMVIAITTAAIAQPIAIHTPPKMIQSTFSNRDKADIGFPQDDETSFETDPTAPWLLAPAGHREKSLGPHN